MVIDFAYQKDSEFYSLTVDREIVVLLANEFRGRASELLKACKLKDAKTEQALEMLEGWKRLHDLIGEGDEE